LRDGIFINNGTTVILWSGNDDPLGEEGCFILGMGLRNRGVRNNLLGEEKYFAERLLIIHREEEENSFGEYG
jgi:hypothetical protein